MQPLPSPTPTPEPSPPLDLADMRVLLVLGEELHFDRAATRLHLSQPGPSYRVKRMEDALGFELLSRTRRAVELTAARADRGLFSMVTDSEGNALHLHAEA